MHTVLHFGRSLVTRRPSVGGNTANRIKTEIEQDRTSPVTNNTYEQSISNRQLIVDLGYTSLCSMIRRCLLRCESALSDGIKAISDDQLRFFYPD